MLTCLQDLASCEFWSAIDWTSLDVWTFVVALLSLLAALAAVGVTVHYSRKNVRKQDEQLRLAREEAARRPVLEVANVGLNHISQVQQAKDALQDGYRGPFPDYVLAVTLTNKGKDPALEISGRLFIKRPLVPVEFKYLDTNITTRSVDSWLHIVTLDAPAGFKLRREANFDRLGFAVPIKVETQQPIIATVKYIFTPLQGESIEGNWHLEVPPR